MIAGAESMACGGCGCGTYKIFRHEESNRLLVECTNCGSVSQINSYEPRLQVNWCNEFPGSEGCLTVMEPRETPRKVEKTPPG